MSDKTAEGCVALVLWLGFAGFLGGYCVQYDVQVISTYFKGHAVFVPYLPCFIAGLFLSQLAVPIALLLWLLSFVV